jgi:hypothetical protein
MGKDKATIPEKLDYIKNHINFIKAIGEDPLTNQ